MACVKSKPKPSDNAKPVHCATTLDDLRKVERLRALRDDPLVTEGEQQELGEQLPPQVVILVIGGISALRENDQKQWYPKYQKQDKHQLRLVDYLLFIHLKLQLRPPQPDCCFGHSVSQRQNHTYCWGHNISPQKSDSPTYI